MPALAGLAQLVDGTPGHHFAAVADEHLEHVLQVQRARLAVDQGHHVDAEHALQLGLGIEVVEDHLAHLAATQLDDHAHAVLVGLVAQLGNTLDLLLFHQLGDLSINRALFNWYGSSVMMICSRPPPFSISSTTARARM